jgi:hypothetical protein
MPLTQREVEVWLSEWEPTFQDAADEIGGETITIRVKRWIAAIEPGRVVENDAIIDRIDQAITRTLDELRDPL